MAARAGDEQQPPAANVASNEITWDTGLHLPPWVSSNERLQIEAKLDQWVRDLCQVTLLQTVGVPFALQSLLLGSCRLGLAPNYQVCVTLN